MRHVFSALLFLFLIANSNQAPAAGNESCSQPVVFNHPPVNLDKIGWIVPLGSMSGNHVTPVDHQYYRAAHDNQIEVYSPAAGLVTTIERMGRWEEQRSDWRLIIRHTCSIESIFIHIDELTPKLAAGVAKTRRSARVRIPVSPGEIVGFYDHNVDYNVVDRDITIGLLNHKSFANAEPWKIHVQDPFVYFNQKLQRKMAALSLRDQKPYGGKIDYDIEGRLIGMWFKEGTNGYAGAGPNRFAYHQGHLAIAPHHLDPSYTVVSFGTFGKDTSGRQFGIRGKNLDPAAVGVHRKVKWELVNTRFYVNGKRWDRNSPAKGIEARQGSTSYGTVVMELIEPGKLKMEVFVGKKANKVSGFSGNEEFFVR